MNHDWICLLVDLSGSNLAQSWQSKIEGQSFAARLSFVQSVEEAQVMINAGNVLVLVVFTNEYSQGVQSLLRSYQANIGCIAEFQAIVCDDPHPVFMAGAFEFGVEQFIGTQTWPNEVAAIVKNAVALATDPKTNRFRLWLVLP